MAHGRTATTIDVPKFLSRLNRMAMEPETRNALKRLVLSLATERSNDRAGIIGSENGYAYCSSCTGVVSVEFDYCPWCGKELENGEEDDETRERKRREAWGIIWEARKKTDG